MPRKKVVPVVQIVELDFGGMFPFMLNIVYKKGANIEDIIREASDIDENLISLARSLEDDDRVSLSMVYKHNGTTMVYVFIDDNITIDTIIHESNHIVFRVFEIVGSNINEETEEFFSYIDTDIFKKVYQVITEQFKLNPPVLYSE